MSEPVTAIILAGRRPGSDPLLDGTDAPTKAVLPIAGRPMLAWVVTAMRAVPDVRRIIVLAQDSAMLAAHPALAELAPMDDLEFVDSQGGISQSLRAVLGQVVGPALVTTTDHVLLTPAMIGDFLAGSSGADVAVGMVERATLLAAYPQSRRTWYKFRAGWWSGANLFRLGGMQAAPLLDLWSEVEQDRKKGLKIVAAFGPWLLLATVLRLITIHQGVAAGARKLGLTAKVVPMAQAEACIDADKPADIVLIEQILAARAGTD